MPDPTPDPHHATAPAALVLPSCARPAPDVSEAAADPAPELDVEFYRRASHHAALIHGMRVQREQLAWISRHLPLRGARKAQHTRKLRRSDALLPDLAALLIARAAW